MIVQCERYIRSPVVPRPTAPKEEKPIPMPKPGGPTKGPGQPNDVPPIVGHNKNEMNIILSCKQKELFQLEHLVQAGELQYINQTLADISEKLVTDFQHKHKSFSEFIQNCLTPVMYLLKRLQNLDHFMTTLIFKYHPIQQKSIHQSTERTNLSLRMLVHVLFINSDIFLRRIVMSLLSKRNPVPFISPNIENSNKNEQYEFMTIKGYT
ncbi:unnamed protein product [Didymodactylos carnosus]|uniref:Uncharacterized protein n=1 Tax=Didymodactylos carnosus TaxID=1234261 RepID=A0A814S2E4_9BILA|nr:unnamed protein product [Didymodactylos carnosus]CAF3905924.1 unnamed protein product [Didymodactylos carnosus]